MRSTQWLIIWAIPIKKNDVIETNFGQTSLLDWHRLCMTTCTSINNWSPQRHLYNVVYMIACWVPNRNKKITLNFTHFIFLNLKLICLYQNRSQYRCYIYLLLSNLPVCNSNKFVICHVIKLQYTLAEIKIWVMKSNFGKNKWSRLLYIWHN